MLSKSKGSKVGWNDTSFSSMDVPQRSKSPYLESNHSTQPQQPTPQSNQYTRSHTNLNHAPPIFQTPPRAASPAMPNPPAQNIPSQPINPNPVEPKFNSHTMPRPSTVYSTQPPTSTTTVNSKTHKKSNSLGLPTLKKSKVKVALFFDQPFYTAGSLLTGRLEMTCMSNESIKLADIQLEVTGYEELRIEHSPNSTEKVKISRNSRVFYKTNLVIQDSQHFCEAVDPSQQPDLEGYWVALKGKTSFPFALKLADTLPNSVTTGVGKIEYKVEGLVKAKIGIFKHNVTFSKPVDVYEVWNAEEVSKYRVVGVQDEVKKKLFLGGPNHVEMWAELVRGLVFAGGIAYIRVLIKNQSSKKVQGIKCSLWKNVSARSDLLVGPNKLGADAAPKLVTDINYDGEDYKFEPKQDRLVMIAMTIPSGSLSLRNTSIIQISYFIKIAVSSNMSKDLEVNLPLYVSHPASWVDPVPYLIPNSEPPTPPEEVPPEIITNPRVLKTTFAEPVPPTSPASDDSFEYSQDPPKQINPPAPPPLMAPVKHETPPIPSSTPIQGRKPPPLFTPASSVLAQPIERIKSEPFPEPRPFSDTGSLMDMLESDKSFQWIKDYSMSEKIDTLSEINETASQVEPIPEPIPETKPPKTDNVEKLVINGKVYYVVPEPGTPKVVADSPASDEKQDQKEPASPINSSYHQPMMQTSSAPTTLSQHASNIDLSTSPERRSNNPFVSNEHFRKTSVSRSKAIRRDSRASRISKTETPANSSNLMSTPLMEDKNADSSSLNSIRAPLTSDTFQPPNNSWLNATSDQLNAETTLKRSETHATVTSSTGSMTSAGFIQSINAMPTEVDQPPRNEMQYSWDTDNNRASPLAAVHTPEQELKKMAHPLLPIKRVSSKAIRPRRSVHSKVPRPREEITPANASPALSASPVNSSNDTMVNQAPSPNQAHLEQQLHMLQAQMASLMASLQSTPAHSPVPSTASGANTRSRQARQKLKAKLSNQTTVEQD